MLLAMPEGRWAPCSVYPACFEHQLRARRMQGLRGVEIEGPRPQGADNPKRQARKVIIPYDCVLWKFEKGDEELSLRRVRRTSQKG